MARTHTKISRTVTTKTGCSTRSRKYFFGVATVETSRNGSLVETLGCKRRKGCIWNLKKETGKKKKKSTITHLHAPFAPSLPPSLPSFLLTLLHTRSYFDWETGKTDIRYRDCHQYSLDDAEQTPFPPKARTY